MRKEIETLLWEPFVVGELFDIHPTIAYKLTNIKLLDGGKNPVVVNSAYNNGIGGYSTQPTTEKGNMITFSDTVDANTIFYQENDFIGYPHVQGLYPKGKYKDKWNKYCLMFFATILRKTALTKGFDYGNKFRRDIAMKLSIKLPVLKKDSPHWVYMETYMRNLQKNAINSLTLMQSLKLHTKNKIEIKNWQKFELQQLFVITKGSRLTKKDMKEGAINYIGASSFNNGITNHISNSEHIHPGGTLTTTYNGSDIGRTFYQEKSFWATDDVNVLYPRFEINKYRALFLAPLIKAAGINYVYKNKWQIDDMKRSFIYLPVKNQEPDWVYIESYMKALEKRSSHIINCLTEYIITSMKSRDGLLI